jgi:hypothetical protein
MKSKPYESRSLGTLFRPVLTQQEFYEVIEEKTEGWCLGCAETQSAVGPDGSRVQCENCGRFLVYGFEQLLLRGLLTIE